jgi:membrane-anchored glycerophosphoryl diester phosphodiesterase (GDPDase)
MYIIYNIKTGLHIRDTMDSELKHTKKQHLLHMLNYFDVSVVYGIMELLIKLILIGTVIYILCVQKKTGIAYLVTSLILIVWISGLVHFAQVYSNLSDVNSTINASNIHENLHASINGQS